MCLGVIMSSVCCFKCCRRLPERVRRRVNRRRLALVKFNERVVLSSFTDSFSLVISLLKFILLNWR